MFGTDFGPSYTVSTVGDQTFPVAAARTWNSLTQRHVHTLCVCVYPRSTQGLSL